jgi:thiol-disulfide isomerase/thioredoxin
MLLKTKRLATFPGLLLATLLVCAALPARAFDVTDTSGKRHRIADYRGRWVVVNFWATWCTPCIREIPEIAAFAKAHDGKDAIVIGIALDVEDATKVLEFAKKTGHDYPLVLGDPKVEKQFGRVKGLPTTLIFDPKGKRVYDRLGTVTKKSLEDVLGATKDSKV